MVGDGKDTGYLICEKSGHVFVHLVHDSTLEGNVTIFDEDADWWDGAHGVAAEGGLAEDGAVDGDAEAVVIGRKRKDLDVVDDFFYAADALDDVGGRAGEHGAGDLSGEDHLAALEGVSEIIEDSIEGEGDEFFPDAVSQPLLF